MKIANDTLVRAYDSAIALLREQWERLMDNNSLEDAYALEIIIEKLKSLRDAVPEEISAGTGPYVPQVGDRVRTLQEMVYHWGKVIPAGEIGTVIRSDDDDDIVMVRFNWGVFGVWWDELEKVED